MTDQEIQKAMLAELQKIKERPFYGVELIVRNNPKAVVDNLLSAGHFVTSESEALAILEKWYKNRQEQSIRKHLTVDLLDKDVVTTRLFEFLNANRK